MRSWALLIQDKEQIPDYFQKDYAAEFGNGETPYMLFNPSQRLDKEEGGDERLLCLAPDRMVIFSRNDIPFICKLEDVIYAVHKELLLAYSISVFTANSMMEFAYNSACSDLFRPVLACLRPQPLDASAHATDREQLRVLVDTDLKFLNYGRQVLAGSGKLIDFLYQGSQIEASILSSHTLLASHILLLTDTELIWVADEKKDWAREPVYGGIFNFVKRANVVGSQIGQADENGIVQLTVTLKGNKQWLIGYQSENLAALQRIGKAIQAWIV
jgi:hypothetical protein